MSTEQQRVVREKALSIRAHPLVFGVVVFLGSELMLFAALFAAYYDLRAIDPTWPPPDVHLDVVEGTVGTILLGISSLSMLLAQRFWSRRKFRLARVLVFVTLLLGAAFLGIAVHGWEHDTFHISTHAYGSLYYMMTGIHALHVSAGLLLLTALVVGLRKPAFSTRDFAGAEAISYYWHFVFIVWVGIYGSIYIVR